MSVLDETLLMFASVRTQLEGTKATLAATRSTLLKLGNCDDEVTRVNRMISDADTVLARIAPKIKYVSALTAGLNTAAQTDQRSTVEIWNSLGRRSKLALARRDARELADIFGPPEARKVSHAVSAEVLAMADNYAKKVRK